jgi:hypothetical protein
VPDPQRVGVDRFCDGNHGGILTQHVNGSASR